MDLSVVMLTWNAWPLTQVALGCAVRGCTGLRHEIILVDNGSTDGTLEEVRAKYPGVNVIANETNRGVARARNQALRASRGKYVLILDNDTEFAPDVPAALIAFMEAHPRAGLAGPKLVSPDGSLQLSCRRVPTWYALFSSRIPLLRQVRSGQWRDYVMTDDDHTTPRPVEYVLGACQIVRREAINWVGLLEERIFYGPEDADYCLRMWLAGWQVWYAPTITVSHVYSRITRGNPLSRVARAHWRGWALLMRKHRANIPAVRKAVAEAARAAATRAGP